MADDILAALGPALTRWTMGGAAATLAPPGWTAALGSDAADAELRLLALSGHFLGSFAAPAPAGPLRDLPDLPRLALPTLAPRLRPLVRRILGTADARQRRIVIGFVAARGRTLHPGDWLPAAGEDRLPEVYAPWCDWAAAVAAGHGRAAAAAELLTAETWHDFGPAARATRLGELRRRDPAAARDLIATRLAAADADERLRLVAALAIGLGADDLPLLDSLDGDRAPRVKAQAAALRARLGVGDGAGADAAELAGFFEIQSRGLLRPTRSVVPRPTKTHAQAQRRAALLQTVGFGAFAAALGLAAGELAALWPWDGYRLLAIGLAACAERSADAAAFAALCTAVAAAAPDLAIIGALHPRLSEAQGRPLLQPALARLGAGTFTMAVELAGPDPRFDDLAATPAFAAILAELAPGESGTRAAPPDLWALGWLAAPAAARALRDRLVAAGLAAADPRLDTLRLNILLDEETPQ